MGNSMCKPPTKSGTRHTSVHAEAAKTSPAAQAPSSTSSPEASPSTEPSPTTATALTTIGATAAGPLRAYLTGLEHQKHRQVILVLHGKHGLRNDFMHELSHYAQEGFVVIAPDLFYGIKPTTDAEADDLILKLAADWSKLLALLQFTQNYIETNFQATNVMAIGYGQTASWLLQASIARNITVSKIINLHGNPLILEQHPNRHQLVGSLHIFSSRATQVDLAAVQKMRDAHLSPSNIGPATSSTPTPFLIRTYDHFTAEMFMDPTSPDFNANNAEIAEVYQHILEFLREPSK